MGHVNEIAGHSVRTAPVDVESVVDAAKKLVLQAIHTRSVDTVAAVL